jgi:hypothetical protein
MALHIQPQIETRPAPAPAQRESQAHLPLRARLKTVPSHQTTPQQARVVSTQASNIALAGLQLLLGYEWLVSGVDKLLFGAFPASLGGLLTSALNGGQLPGFFAALLRALVAPNATLFGYLIEWGETLAGVGLVTAGLVALLRPLLERHLRGALAALFAPGIRLLDGLSPLAAAGAGLLGLSFFLLDGLPAPWFMPSIAYGGAIDTGLFLAAASVVLVGSQLVQRRQRH